MFNDLFKPINKLKPDSSYLHSKPILGKVPLDKTLRILSRWGNRIRSKHSVITLPYLVFNILSLGGGLKTMASPTKCIVYNEIHISIYVKHNKNVLNDSVRGTIENTGSLLKQ